VLLTINQLQEQEKRQADHSKGQAQGLSKQSSAITHNLQKIQAQAATKLQPSEVISLK
jgi:hypothetical protein